MLILLPLCLATVAAALFTFRVPREGAYVATSSPIAYDLRTGRAANARSARAFQLREVRETIADMACDYEGSRRDAIEARYRDLRISGVLRDHHSDGYRWADTVAEMIANGATEAQALEVA